MEVLFSSESISGECSQGVLMTNGKPLATIAAHPAAISGIDHINCPHQPRHSPVTFSVLLVLVLFPPTISFD